MEGAGIGAGLWGASFLARQAIAKSLFKQDSNDIVNRIHEGKAQFLTNILERQIKQDIFKFSLPLIGGIISIVGGLAEGLVMNEPQVAMGLLSFGIMHTGEAMIYRANRPKPEQ